MNLDEIRQRKKSSSRKIKINTSDKSYDLKNENNSSESMSYGFIKNNQLICKLSSLDFLFSIDLDKLKNTTIQNLYSLIRVQSQNNNNKNLENILTGLQSSDFIYFLCKPKTNSFKEALRFTGNYSQSRLLKETELFMLGKLIYRKGKDVKGYFKIKYEDIELKVEADAGVIDIKEETKNNEISETDPNFTLLGFLLMMKIIHGYCHDLILLSTFPHDLKIRLSDSKGSLKVLTLIEKDTTIPTRKSEYVSSGLWNSIDIFLGDTLIMKSLPISLNKILKEIELEIDCTLKPILRIKGKDGEIQKIEINKNINL